jgi:hypothetical protein
MRDALSLLLAPRAVIFCCAAGRRSTPPSTPRYPGCHNRRCPLLLRCRKTIYSSEYASLPRLPQPSMPSSVALPEDVHHSPRCICHPRWLSPLVPLTTSVVPLPALRGTRFCHILVSFNSLLLALMHTTTALMPFAFPSMFLHSCRLPTVVCCCCTCPQHDRSDPMVSVDLMSPSVVGAGSCSVASSMRAPSRISFVGGLLAASITSPT